MEDKKPTFLDKVKSVVKDWSIHIGDGMRNVPPEEYIRRTSICNSCVKFIHKDDTCGVCGCLMGIKAKWRTSSCPDKKWVEWEEESKE